MYVVCICGHERAEHRHGSKKGTRCKTCPCEKFASAKEPDPLCRCGHERSYHVQLARALYTRGACRRFANLKGRAEIEPLYVLACKALNKPVPEACKCAVFRALPVIEQKTVDSTDDSGTAGPASR
jgi:hypothetical protein